MGYLDVPMPLTPHHDVHPWRQRIGLITLAVVIVAGGAMLWNHRVAADMIQRSVNQWMGEGATGPDVEERFGKEVPVPASQGADEANASDATDPIPTP